MIGNENISDVQQSNIVHNLNRWKWIKNTCNMHEVAHAVRVHNKRIWLAIITAKCYSYNPIDCICYQMHSFLYTDSC